jgi:signal transduction histidine kinase
MTILRAGDIQGARTGQGAPWFARLGDWLGSRPAPDALDALIAAGCFAGFTLPVLLVPAWGAGPRWAIAVLAALAAVPLIARRRQPVPVAVVLTCVYVAAALAGIQFTPFVSCAGPNLAVAIFTVADRCSRRVSVPVAAVASLVTWAVLAPAIHLHPAVGQDAVQAAVIIPAWLAGDIVRTRREYRRSLAEEGRRQEAEREARIRAEERLALSRDVHDVVSHSLSLIAVQSGAARLVLAERPAEARAVLAAIETASRSALDEVRLLLRQIRAPGPAGGGQAPGLADLAELAGRMRASGLDLTYRCHGQRGEYPPAVEVSAYRIAQEALTNVSRHAPGARVTLEVSRTAAAVTISVTDDGGGAAPRPPGAGLGIAGMRERALMHGGELRAGARTGGGFEVVAMLPAVPPEAVSAEPGPPGTRTPQALPPQAGAAGP